MKLRLPMLALILCLFMSSLALAHTPILWVTEIGDGSILIEGGFSNQESAAGVPIYVVDAETFDGDVSLRDTYLTLLKEFSSLHEIKLEEETLLPASYNTMIGPLLFEGKLVLFTAELDEEASLVIMKPGVDYLLVLDAGPGHVLVRKAPSLNEEERHYITETLGLSLD